MPRPGAGSRAWFVAARKLITIAAALLLGVVGAGLSAKDIAGVLAGAAAVPMLWNIWDRAHANARKGEDPGPGLVRAHRSA
jgi:hypothetical protein